MEYDLCHNNNPNKPHNCYFRPENSVITLNVNKNILVDSKSIQRESGGTRMPVYYRARTHTHTLNNLDMPISL